MLICNGKIKTMNGPVIENGFVRTRGRLIQEIGDMKDLKSSGDDVVLDVSGSLVMPGIIDAHSHIGIMEEKKGNHRRRLQRMYRTCHGIPPRH